MMQLLMFALYLPLIAGQPSITNLALSDSPTDERGYIIASADTTVGSITSPVCGSVDLLTAWITCMSVGWLGVTGAGTAQGLGITGPNVVREPILLNNLTCTNFANTAAGKEFECTVSTTVPICASSYVAAVSCYFSIGQVAGIAAGLFALCLLLAVLPIIFCCVCCCCGIGCAASRRA